MTRPATQEERWDHDHDQRKHEPNPAFDKRAAVAALIGHCESIVSSGVLTDPAERSLRLLIAHTLVAFEMPSRVERESEPA